MTQFLVEEAAFAALEVSEAQPARSADPEERAWQEHMESHDQAMGR